MKANELHRSLLVVLISLSFNLSYAQYTLEPAEGYSHDIGLMVSMMEDLRARITEEVKDLNQEETDYRFDENANSVGALIMHLVARRAIVRPACSKPVMSSVFSCNPVCSRVSETAC